MNHPAGQHRQNCCQLSGIEDRTITPYFCLPATMDPQGRRRRNPKFFQIGPHSKESNRLVSKAYSVAYDCVLGPPKSNWPVPYPVCAFLGCPAQRNGYWPWRPTAAKNDVSPCLPPRSAVLKQTRTSSFLLLLPRAMRVSTSSLASPSN